MPTSCTLHHGERKALALCVTNFVNHLITDDTVASLAAKSLNIRGYRKLGLLISAVRKRLKTPSELTVLLATGLQQIHLIKKRF